MGRYHSLIGKGIDISILRAEQISATLFYKPCNFLAKVFRIYDIYKTYIIPTKVL